MFFIPNGPHLAVIIEPNEHFDLVLYFKSDIYNPASDGLETAVTNHNHSEQSRCISATFLF